MRKFSCSLQDGFMTELIEAEDEDRAKEYYLDEVVRELTEEDVEVKEAIDG